MTLDPNREEIQLSAVLKSLADNNRRAIIVDLYQQQEDTERTCISFDVPLSKSSRTFHFKNLRDAGLVWHTDYGNRSAVVLRRDDIEARFPGLLGAIAHDEQ